MISQTPIIAPSVNGITGLSNSNPVVNGIASSGGSTYVSRDDHVHPSSIGLPGGTDTQIQFNSSGSLYGTPNLAYDYTNGVLNINQATELSNNPLAIAGTNAGTVQANIQNKSSSNAASSDFIATADNGSDTTHYIDYGINSSTYNQSAYSITGANDGYLYVSGGNICIGTDTSGKYIKFHTGGTQSTNLRVTIDDSGINLPTGNTFRINGVPLSGSVSSVNGYTGAVVLVANDVGLGNVNNTSDANKPVSTAAQTALNLKLDSSDSQLIGTGIISGGTISINANNTSIDITQCITKYRDNSNPSSPIFDTLTCPAQTALTPPALATNLRLWIGVQRASPGVGSIIFSTGFTAVQRRTIAIIGRCWGNGTSTVTGTGQYSTPSWGVAKTLEDLLDTLGSQNRSGNVFSANSGTLTLNKSAGESFRFSGFYSINADSPNIGADAQVTGISNYDYQLLSDNVGIISALTAIDPNNYDVGGVLTSVPSGQWTIQRIYQFPRSEFIDIGYGQATYSSLAASVSAINTEAVSIGSQNATILYGSMLRGWICIKQGTTDLASANVSIIPNIGTSSGSSIPPSSGGGGSSTNLAPLFAFAAAMG